MFSLSLFATEWVGINSDQPAKAEITLLSSDSHQSTIHFSIDGFTKNLVQTPRGEAWIPGLENGGLLLEKGAPQLPLLAASVIIPDQSGTRINILYSEYTDYQDVLIAPSKGNLYRDIDPATLPFEFGQVYNQDEFYPGGLAELSEPGHQADAIPIQPGDKGSAGIPQRDP